MCWQLIELSLSKLPIRYQSYQVFKLSSCAKPLLALRCEFHCMKMTLLALVSFIAGTVFAGPETIIRERAKELRDQNNVRQGVATPAQPVQPTPSTAPSTVPAANAWQAAGVSRLPADLAAVKMNAPVPVSQNQLITQDVMAIAGVTKVSSATAAKLAHSMSEALAAKGMTAVDRSRLAQDLNAALGTSNMPQTQMQAVLADIQAIFQANGLPRNNAVEIVNNVKAITAEVKAAAK
jgi:hypothetical protein